MDYNKQNMSSDEEIERFWSSVKGKAIARECNKFYSQYEGQSWKNVISIGDSDFERLGTQNAMENYMRETGIDSDGLVDVNGHMYKVRTKTFKMLDEPTVEVGHRFEPHTNIRKKCLQNWTLSRPMAGLTDIYIY